MPGVHCPKAASPGLELSCAGSWPGTPSTAKDRPVLEASFCPPDLLSIFSPIQAVVLQIEAQRGSLTLPGSLSRCQLWLGFQPELETRSLDFLLGLSPSLQCPCPDDRATSLSGWDNSHREERWHAALSQSRWAFWINSPAVVLRSRSTKGPTGGRDGAGVWAAQLHAHGDNRGFQSREARVSSEIVLAQRVHSGLWSQTIPGGGTLGVHRDNGALGSRPHPATAGPITATPHLWDSVSHL